MRVSVLEMLRNGKSKDIKIVEHTTFYNQTRNKLTYHSGVLDGIRLSAGQVEFVGENGGGVDIYTSEPITLNDIRETSNHFACFDYILEQAMEPVTEEMLRQCHKIMKSGTYSSFKDEPGNFKTRKNTIGQMATTEPTQVKEELTKLLKEYNEYSEVAKLYVDDIFFFHCDLIKISPFPDCNGRIARMIMFKECLRVGIRPFMIEDVQKSYYYRVLKDCRKNRNLAYNLCLQAQKKYENMVLLYQKKI